MRRTSLILFAMCLSLLMSIPVHAESSVKFKLWSMEWTEEDEIISYKIVDIVDSQHTPRGILDWISKDIKVMCPKIVLIKNDVAYVNFEGDSDYITTRSGTTGAQHFAATVVFNLTEFENIKYVYFVDWGDHFVPGKYERLDFWRLMALPEKNKYRKYIEDRLNAKYEDVARYVEFLQDIGDSNSVLELDALKKQMKKVGYAGCYMTEKEFGEMIDKTINMIIKRTDASSDTSDMM